MNIADFTNEQREALLDLLVLAMYADGHLASAEEARLGELLLKMGAQSDSDRDRQLDAAVTRVRQHAASTEAAQAYAASLTQAFQARNQRRRVLDLMDDLMATDSHITLTEGSLSTVVREALRL
jgi:uncharacterized tellurite resistance protein B-like protein